MKVITRQGLANSAPARWAEVYGNGHFASQPDKQEVLAKLAALAHPIDPDKVDAIIGNTSWTTQSCHECGRESELVIEVGQEPDYESCTANMCIGCLEAALSLASNNSSPDQP